MKLALDVSIVSSQCFAAGVGLLFGVLAAVGWPYRALAARLIVVIIGLAAGIWLWRKRAWLVMHASSDVVLQLKRTLEMSQISFDEHHPDSGNRNIKVLSTGTTVTVRGCWRTSLVAFDVSDPNCNKERFLIEMLTKYLRLIGRIDDHGISPSQP